MNHFQAISGIISIVEAWGFIIGSVWGLLGLIYLDSFRLTMIIAIVALLIVMIITIIKLEFLLLPHWSYQIERQESLLKYYH